ncbi:MAG: hypothetical protein HP052_02065 [Firmicutes bacterium]|nr:hypothetical protein [Bacillota bacterium]
MDKYLVETALIGQGLVSIPDQKLLAAWRYPKAKLAWLEAGEIKLGPLAEFLPLRPKAKQLIRIDAASLAASIKAQATGVLTASATMAIGAKLQIPLIVTCGMGGIGPHPNTTIGSDLIALKQWPVTLIASSPKDVFDLPATFAWLRNNGVAIIGANSDICDGFLTRGPAYKLDGTIAKLPLTPHLLILNELAKRPVNTENLLKAMREGERVQQQGGYYHPAVNQKLAKATNGESALAQLTGLLANIALAQQL